MADLGYKGFCHPESGKYFRERKNYPRDNFNYHGNNLNLPWDSFNLFIFHSYYIIPKSIHNCQSRHCVRPWLSFE